MGGSFNGPRFSPLTVQGNGSIGAANTPVESPYGSCFAQGFMSRGGCRTLGGLRQATEMPRPNKFTHLVEPKIVRHDEDDVWLLRLRRIYKVHKNQSAENDKSVSGECNFHGQLFVSYLMSSDVHTRKHSHASGGHGRHGPIVNDSLP